MKSANSDKIKKAVAELMMRIEYEYKPKKGVIERGRFIVGYGEDDDGDMFIEPASCIPTPVVQFLLGEIEKPKGLTIKLYLLILQLSLLQAFIFRFNLRLIHTQMVLQQKNGKMRLLKLQV